MRIIVFFILGCMVWSSCDFINPEEPRPTYVTIDSFAFQSTPGTGTASQKFTSVWVYFNNAPVGVFDLPATFPVIADKPGFITAIPGVTMAGLNDFQSQYPFFKGDTISLTPLQDIHFTPTARYFDTSVLKFWFEDFEFGSSFAKVYGDTDLTKTNDPLQVFEGNYSGLISLGAGQTAEVISTLGFTGGANTYLELNYKCSIPFEVGMFTQPTSSQPVSLYLFGFKAKTEWNKVYIPLGDFIGAYPNNQYFVLIKTTADAQAGGYVLLDNLKAVSSK